MFFNIYFYIFRQFYLPAATNVEAALSNADPIPSDVIA
jgi:hypothetical protein